MSDERRDDEGLPEITAYLVLGGRGFDVEDCTKTVGLRPTRLWKQSRPALAAREDLCTESWSVGIEKARLDDTDTALGRVLEMVWPVRDRIKSYAAERKLRGSFNCNVTITDERPSYSVGAETLEKLAYFGFELVFDIFDYSQ